MIIKFSVSNFRSIKDKQSLSFLPETKLGKDQHNENLIPATANPYGIKLLKSVCLYGANASGKSNILAALHELKKMMTIKLTKNAAITAYQPFLLDKESSYASATFELDFIAHNNIRYEYIIEVKAKQVLFESLYFYPHENRKRIAKVKLFEKTKQQISFGTHFKGRKDFDFYPNQSFLSLASDTPIEDLTAVYTYIENLKTAYTNFLDENPASEIPFLANMFNDKAAEVQKAIFNANAFVRNNLTVLAKEADIGIHAIKITELGSEENEQKEMGLHQLNEVLKTITPKDATDEEKEEVKNLIIAQLQNKTDLFHTKKVEFLRAIYYQDKIAGYQAAFGLDLESKGTLAMLAIAIPLLQTLEIGGFIAVDEIEQNLHPKLHQLLIGLFNTTQNNPNNAQIIFTTHDVTMINRDFFRFDQIVFAEKNKKGESIIYRLSDFDGISKVEALEKWYMLGRFGATPIIAQKENIFLHFPKPNPNV